MAPFSLYCSLLLVQKGVEKQMTEHSST